MFASKFREKMTNYYVVYVGKKRGVCDSWIECQKRVIFYEGVHTKPAFLETKLCDHGCYIHQRLKTLDGFGVRISSPTPNCGLEDKKNKLRSVQVLYTSISLLGS